MTWSSRMCCGPTSSAASAQYSAQSPQRAAGGRNTTILSHLADVPVLLILPPPSSAASTVTHVFTGRPVGSASVGGRADNQTFIVSRRDGCREVELCITEEPVSIRHHFPGCIGFSRRMKMFAACGFICQALLQNVN